MIHASLRARKLGRFLAVEIHRHLKNRTAFVFE